MKQHYLTIVLAAAAATISVSLPVAAQSTAAKKQNWKAPKTGFGDPDLQGVWTNVTITPLERPANLAGKEVFTPEEAADFEKRTVTANNADRRGNLTPEQDVGLAYNDAWYDRGTKVIGTRRTSLIIDPPDGRIPALTADGQARQTARAEARRRMGPADGPESRGLQERCLLWPTAGPPMLPSFYNNNYQIVQSPGYVTIMVEMIHDTRIIPVDGRPHLPSNVRQWMGDSRGHWEGDTLVVETTNFTNKTAFRGTSESMKLIERFRRADADTLVYEFTVDDPSTFTKPWTAQIPMRKGEGQVYEYACHEGNYAMENMLAGARRDEAAAASK
jgi:hypothetical protein